MSQSRSILFVCYGNIMRSAFAEACLLHELSQSASPANIRVASAGVRAASNEHAEPNARRMAQRFGLSLDHHRATRTTKPLIDQFDEIYYMDALNEDLLFGEFPEIRPKARLLNHPHHIEDPYLKPDQDLEACFRSIQHSIRRLLL